jgi:putative ABC transport system permease protein
LRDLRYAKGRFALIISVVVLITMLVGLLSGLMTGLRGQNISAIDGIAADRIVFSAPAGDASLAYGDSALSADQVTAWTGNARNADVQPVGIAMGKVTTDSGQLTVSLFGVQPGFQHASGNVAPASPGEIVLTHEAADRLGASAGDQVSIAGTDFIVASISADTWYSHTPVVWMSLDDWQAYASATGDPGVAATVLAISGLDRSQVDRLNEATGTVDSSVSGSFNAIGGYKSENGSLMAMLGMLLAISGLVIGAFFTVWTIQRTSDVAILKALGASTWSLVKDALGQAIVVLAIGVGIGLALTTFLGRLAESFVPFVLSLSTTLVPGALLMGLGIAGAAFALRTIVTSDPLTAIGANR